MKMQRTENASRNVVFGFILKIYQIIVPFLMRTVMIHFMGVQYLGLGSLFTSILQVLNLAELGVGSAMVYSMYRPIAMDDKKTICALMRLYQRYYYIIGAVIAAAGIFFTPLIPKMVNGVLPEGVNLYILYFLNLGATVLSYWLFAYKNCLFQAHQREDVVSKVSLLVATVQYLFQFYIVIWLKNYYLYVIVNLFGTVAVNVLTAVFANRVYPHYKPKGQLTHQEVKQINQRVRDLFTAKLGGVIVNSADSIVISAILGLTVLAVYQNYYYILNSILGFTQIIFTSCIAGIGNSLITENSKKNFHDLMVFSFLIYWISGVCTTCLFCLYQPFMKIWVGEQLMLDFKVVMCFCVYFYVLQASQILFSYKDAAGIWYEDRFRPLVTALSNLVMNLIMVRFWGIYGVILSTVISTALIGMPWLLYNLFHILFEPQQLFAYLRSLGIYTCMTIIACAITHTLCSLVHMGDIATLIVRGGICCVVPNMFFLVVYHNQKEFVASVQIVDRITKGKLHLQRWLNIV